MDSLALRLSCIFIILMYCLTPLAAVDLGNDNYTKYISQDANDKIGNDSNDKIISQDANDSDIEVKHNSSGDALDSINDSDVKNDAKEIEEDSQVNKTIDPDLKIDVDDVSMDEEAVAEISADNDFRGYVNVYVEGNVKHQVFLSNGHAKVSLGVLDSGEHKATVKFAGDEKFKQSNDSTTFKVGMLKWGVFSPELTIHVDDSIHQKDIVAKVTANKNFNGIVHVHVIGSYGETFDVKVTNGYGEASYRGLGNGFYKVYAYNDEVFPFYSQRVQSEYFTVKKLDADLKVNVDNITYGDKAVVKLTAVEDFTDHVKVTVNAGDDYQDVFVENGYGETTLEGLTADEYFVLACFDGNDDYGDFIKVNLLTVDKADPALSIHVDNNFVGDKAVAKITANKIFTGHVSVSVTGHAAQDVLVKDGYGEATFEGLSDGKYNANVKYDGNINFTSSEATTVFTVDKGSPILRIHVDNIHVGDKAVSAKITANNSFTGHVSVSVSGHAPQNVYVKNGYGLAIFAGLSVGEYNATVKFDGNDRFISDEWETSFFVFKNDPCLTLNVHNVNLGNDAVATITAKKGFTGHVSVSVSGHAAQDVLVENGYGQAIFEGLSVGEYNATVKFDGDENFTADNATTSFKVEE